MPAPLLIKSLGVSAFCVRPDTGHACACENHLEKRYYSVCRYCSHLHEVFYTVEDQTCTKADIARQPMKKLPTEHL